eukprot:Amastigsp_a508713_414.p3 type:complete len:128 gc:universal Amastigsp_a508713_414:1079-696(-)
MKTSPRIKSSPSPMFAPWMPFTHCLGDSSTMYCAGVRLNSVPPRVIVMFGLFMFAEPQVASTVMYLFRVVATEVGTMSSDVPVSTMPWPPSSDAVCPPMVIFETWITYHSSATMGTYVGSPTRNDEL